MKVNSYPKNFTSCVISQKSVKIRGRGGGFFGKTPVTTSFSLLYIYQRFKLALPDAKKIFNLVSVRII